MNRLTCVITTIVLLAATAAMVPGLRADEVIRLAPRQSRPESAKPVERVEIGEPRRGFDYEVFESHLESLWFQRKTFLANRRLDDANRQLERIRTFCAEEGIRGLTVLSGALIAESKRSLAEGNHDQALAALHYAEAFDPGRPQVFVGRAAVHWSSDGVSMAVIRDLAQAVRASSVRSVRELTVVHQTAYALAVSLILCLLFFSLLMLFRYQVVFRHEVEEFVGPDIHERWAKLIGWIALSIPLTLWFGAGWTAIYWLVICFRFMNRGERMTAAFLLLVCALSMPAYRMIVGVYGTTADPAVRTTLASAKGEYNPERIVKLRRMVEAHPDDPVYRFLLGGLFKNGRYFEEAFNEYRAVLEIAPSLAPAHINIGNIFYATGQYSEAVVNYRRALESEPDSFLAYFNMHLAQSEDFKFSSAEESLRHARELEPGRVTELLSGASVWGDRPAAQDASLRITSIWDAALQGRRPQLSATPKEKTAGLGGSMQVLNPLGVVSILAILLCLVSGIVSRSVEAARRCIRCGRPFCTRCKSGREAREYCSQCVHMYVLGDGLAPGTKARKLYEVERHARRTRRARGILSAVLPGSAQLLRGHSGAGVLFMLFWIGALIVTIPGLISPVLSMFGMSLRMQLVEPGYVPAAYTTRPMVVLGIFALGAVWISANLWRLRRGEK